MLSVSSINTSNVAVCLWMARYTSVGRSITRITTAMTPVRSAISPSRRFGVTRLRAGPSTIKPNKTTAVTATRPVVPTGSKLTRLDDTPYA